MSLVKNNKCIYFLKYTFSYKDDYTKNIEVNHINIKNLFGIVILIFKIVYL